MKKIVTIILTAAFSLALFNGCSEDTEVFPPMNGAWKCTEVSLKSWIISYTFNK